MKKLLKHIYIWLNLGRILPHIILFLFSSKRHNIKKDLERWLKTDVSGFTMLYEFCTILLKYPEFRSLFYARLQKKHHISTTLMKFLCRPMPTLYIHTQNIGPGLFIQHGFSTIIAAKSMGKDCWINQQITIGYSNETDRPIIEDNVTIYAGAKIFGDITIGKNSIIGANAVVVKDVPPNCTVVGVPAYIVKRDGRKTNEPL